MLPLQADFHYTIDLESCSPTGMCKVYAYLHVHGTLVVAGWSSNGTYTQQTITIDRKILPMMLQVPFVVDRSWWDPDIRRTADPTPGPVKGGDPVSFVESTPPLNPAYEYRRQANMPNGVIVSPDPDDDDCIKVTANVGWIGGFVTAAATGSASGSAGAGGSITVGSPGGPGLSLGGSGSASASGSAGGSTGVVSGGVWGTPIVFKICYKDGCTVSDPGDVTDGKQVYDAGGT